MSFYSWSRIRYRVWVLLLMAGLCSSAGAQVTVLGVQYRADQPFPEYDCYWFETYYPSWCSATNVFGGTAHIFLRNNGSSTVTLQDVVFQGESLANVLALQYQGGSREPANIWFPELTGPQLIALTEGGTPVWYKMDPATVAPGATCQVVVRVRTTPRVSPLTISVIHSGGVVSASVPVDSAQPRITSISFSSDWTKVYLYWRRTSGSAAPASILMDGTDVTARTVTVSDPTLNTAVSVFQPSSPLSATSFHVFQGVYSDGQATGAGIRAWANKLVYGTWGARAGDEGDYAAARAWLDDAALHSVNALVVTLGSNALGSYLKTSAGRQYAADRGYGFVIDSIQKWSCTNPLMWFIRDEPDAADSRVTGLPSDQMVGSLAQSCVRDGEDLRRSYTQAPTALNLDMTYKPYNWYNYGQLADVTMSDPYYQARMREAYWYATGRIPLYEKATFVYAVAQTAQSACEPNPLHIILYSCAFIDSTRGETFPFPTPQSKRIEVYYALAGGAKGFSYWWFPNGNPSKGLTAGTADALALWKEMGLLGAEVGAAAPLLVTSAPAALPVQAAAGIWAKTLLVGNDTFIVLAVNDQYVNDPTGCHYTPVANATINVTLPAWMQSPSAFQITTAGTYDIGSQLNGNQLQLNLGTLDLTRMIVVTTNPQTRSTIQQRFDSTYRARACALSPTLCQTSPPAITLHPQPVDVPLGGSATFTVAATGTAPFSYRWQKDQANLADGGHYAGVSTAALSVTTVDAADVASYRCVVTNSFGSATSNQAALTIAAPPTVPSDFDHDGDVDIDDFGRFQRCLSGAVVAAEPGCEPADLDGDGDVDAADFLRFQNCLTGPDVPFNLACLN